MYLTREFIMEHRTRRGGWTKAQLQVIGVEWPPRNGWIGRACGRNITPDQADMFKALGHAKDKHLEPNLLVLMGERMA